MKKLSKKQLPILLVVATIIIAPLLSYYNTQSIAWRRMVSDYEKEGDKIDVVHLEYEVPSIYQQIIYNANYTSSRDGLHLVWVINFSGHISSTQTTGQWVLGYTIEIDFFTGEVLGVFALV